MEGLATRPRFLLHCAEKFGGFLPTGQCLLLYWRALKQHVFHLSYRLLPFREIHPRVFGVGQRVLVNYRDTPVPHCITFALGFIHDEGVLERRLFGELIVGLLNVVFIQLDGTLCCLEFTLQLRDPLAVVLLDS